MIETFGVAVYAACVDFMLQLAALLGVTYRDANVMVLLLAFPAITLVLAAAVLGRGLAQLRDEPPDASGG